MGRSRVAEGHPGRVDGLHLESVASVETAWRGEAKAHVSSRLILFDGVANRTVSADGSDADRVDDTVTNEVAGVTWEFPGREACRACHTEVSGGLLGLTARQVRHHASSRDVLRRWTKDGVLAGDIPKPRKVGRLLSLRGSGKRTKRARSYLDANCASCHRPGAPQPAGLDLRASTDVAETGLLDAPIRGAFGIADAQIVAPRDPDRSILLTRLDLRGDEKQMPPLGTNLPDDRALKSLRRWIRRLR